jgi:hypothetical protein
MKSARFWRSTSPAEVTDVRRTSAPGTREPRAGPIGNGLRAGEPSLVAQLTGLTDPIE